MSKRTFYFSENFILGVRFLSLKVNPQGSQIDGTFTETNKIPISEKERDVHVQSLGLTGCLDKCI